MVKLSTTTVGIVYKNESNPNAAPGEYHGLLQAMSRYMRLLTAVVGSLSVHTQEVVAIRNKLRMRMDLYVDIESQKIL